MRELEELEKVCRAYVTKAVQLEIEGKVEDAITMYLKAIEVSEKLMELRPRHWHYYKARIRAYRKRIRELQAPTVRFERSMRVIACMCEDDTLYTIIFFRRKPKPSSRETMK